MHSRLIETTCNLVALQFCFHHNPVSGEVIGEHDIMFVTANVCRLSDSITLFYQNHVLRQFNIRLVVIGDAQ